MKVRDSERKVKDEIYNCYAELVGSGLSLAEFPFALQTVAKIFGCSWHIPREDKSTYDENSDIEQIYILCQLPTHKQVKKNL